LENRNNDKQVPARAGAFLIRKRSDNSASPMQNSWMVCPAEGNNIYLGIISQILLDSLGESQFSTSTAKRCG
jgi:hypothetical protein